MAALPSLRQLQYLVKLAELRNFTRAAAACHATQSTLSSGLKELESSLGARLVERDRQGVLLTPAGQEVVERARGLLAGASDLAQAASSAGSPMRGILRLGAIPTIAPFVLPQLLQRQRTQYPDLRLALREDRTESLLERLEDGRLDFALLALPYDTGNLLVREICQDELLLVAPAGSMASPWGMVVSPRGNVALNARTSEHLLLLEEGHCLRQHTLQACRSKRSGGRTEGLEATSLLTLVHMAESGLGLALVPELAVRRGLLASTGLTAHRVGPPAPTRGIALVARSSTARETEFTALATLIAEVCDDPPAAKTPPARRRSRPRPR
jgi:LysR family transcriptional regulator, hydrogen peroxide-inducible genes activator